MSTTKKAIVIGAGFSGISSACYLAKEGFEVEIIEKNDGPGGRASKFSSNGFTFDMGPSWYWMPEIFESFFENFGSSVDTHYNLLRLDPGYRIYFDQNEFIDIPALKKEIFKLFESQEPGSSKNLEKFLQEAAYKYQVGIHEFVYKPSLSIKEYFDWRLIKSVFKLQMLKSMSKYVDGLFKHKYLRELLKFPVLFLGATPEKTPAMYSLMNYADLIGGTWYPMGGMHKIIEGMVKVAKSLGVTFSFNQEVIKVTTSNNQVSKVITPSNTYVSDVVICSADYQHFDQKVLDKKDRSYSEKYWNSRTMAPSSLLFFIGVNKKIKNLLHHNLFFDADFKKHAEQVYESPQWPTKPLFYACCPSKTDASVAPEGHENLFLLMPIAPGLTKDDEHIRSKYFEIMMGRMEKITSENIRDHIVYKKSFGLKDFNHRYNSFKGNAYGLANTLKQTALFKPSLKSKKLNNLYYTGQLTVPGPGVPPSIISGQVVANQIVKEYTDG